MQLVGVNVAGKGRTLIFAPSPREGELTACDFGTAGKRGENW